MRCILTIASLLFFFSSAPTADANYLIKLKNGNGYITDRYWHNGPQVLFDAYGGVFGIDRAFIAAIERASQRAWTDGRGEISQESRETISKGAENSKAGKEREPEAKPPRSPNDPIAAEFTRLKDRSKQVDTLLTSEILELLKTITAFRNKLSKDSKLFIEYGREFNDAHELGDVVESALRARRQ